VTRVYLDATAIAKLLVREPESQALIEFLGGDAVEAATSAISEVELARALRGSGLPSADIADALRSFIVVSVDAGICQRAASLDGNTLGPLEAVHLATVFAIGTSGLQLLTYDERLAKAARARGLKVVQPGVAG
jgi:predicted nucleic acid-binding protein